MASLLRHWSEDNGERTGRGRLPGLGIFAGRNDGVGASIRDGIVAIARVIGAVRCPAGDCEAICRERAVTLPTSCADGIWLIKSGSTFATRSNLWRAAPHRRRCGSCPLALSDQWHSPVNPRPTGFPASARRSRGGSCAGRVVWSRHACARAICYPQAIAKQSAERAPSPLTLIPVLSTSRCNGPLEPR